MKDGSKDILVATDVAGRGIDIKYDRVLFFLVEVVSQILFFFISVTRVKVTLSLIQRDTAKKTDHKRLVTKESSVSYVALMRP